MLNNFDDAILNIGKSRDNTHGNDKTNDILYSRWDKRYSATLGDFYKDFIELRLPDVDIVRKWHELLIEYSQMDGAIFPIRDGHSDNKDNKKLKLRRGWLVRVDDHIDYERKFSYMFTDNHLAAYIYKMALDGYCPTITEFFDFMTKFKDPMDIKWVQGREIKNAFYKEYKRHFLSMPVHFGWIGKSSYPGTTESEKNAYINTTPSPTCPFGEYGYKHAHIFGVKNGFYSLDGEDKKWEDIKLVELGEESISQKDYQWNDAIKNFVWDRKMKNSDERDLLKKIVVAHFLRFLDPMNHFLAPKQGCNKFTKDNGDYSLDIAEYENLLKYLMFIRENVYGNNFRDFMDAALSPSNMKALDYSAENIDVVYHEDKQETVKKKNKADTAKEVLTKVTKKKTKTKAPSGIIHSTSKRDNSKYSFEGKGEYTKGQVLLQLVKKYIADHSEVDVSNLKNVFDLKLTFNNKMIILITSETTQNMRDGGKVVPMTLPNGATIYINKQVQIGDMKEIIHIAKKLNYPIEKV